jgi:argininosuccinate synthase
MNTRVVLAYSGGLKATVAIPWLIEHYHCQVIAVVLDLGQAEDLADLRQRAMAAGAARCHVIDAREEFARDFVVPSLKADALLEGRFPASTALGRTIIANTLVTIARIEGTRTVAHAGTGRDHLRMTSAAQSLDSTINVISCAEAWTYSDAEVAGIADRLHVAAPSDGVLIDQNLWGRTGGGWVDVDSSGLDDNVFGPTRSPNMAPGVEAVVEIEFVRGVPVALNGVPMQPVELIESLGTIGAEHGIGRLRRVKARAQGRVRHVVHEAPAAVLLHFAHAELQRSTAPGAVQRFVPAVASAYADLIDRGEWFSNLRPALDGFVDQVQQEVTGLVRLKLFKGSVTASGIAEPATAKP